MPIWPVVTSLAASTTPRKSHVRGLPLGLVQNLQAQACSPAQGMSRWLAMVYIGRRNRRVHRADSESLGCTRGTQCEGRDSLPAWRSPHSSLTVTSGTQAHGMPEPEGPSRNPQPTLFPDEESATQRGQGTLQESERNRARPGPRPAVSVLSSQQGQH